MLGQLQIARALNSVCCLNYCASSLNTTIDAVRLVATFTVTGPTVFTFADKSSTILSALYSKILLSVPSFDQASIALNSCLSCPFTILLLFLIFKSELELSWPLHHNLCSHRWHALCKFVMMGQFTFHFYLIGLSNEHNYRFIEKRWPNAYNFGVSRSLQ